MFVRPLVLFSIACTSAKPEVDGAGDEAPSTEESSPGEPDSRAGCARNLEYDEGADGVIDWTEYMAWDPREDEVGDSNQTEYRYDHVAGDYEHWKVDWGEALWCWVAYEVEQSVDGEVDAARSEATCDEHAEWTTRHIDMMHEGNWFAYSDESYVNTYDDEGRLIEQEWTTVYADPDFGEIVRRELWSYSGGLLVRQDVFRHGESDYGTEYAYDDDGNLIQESRYLGELSGYSEDDRELYYRVTYTWDARGNMLTRDEEHLLYGGYAQHEVMTWDEHDRVATNELWTDDGSAHWMKSFVLDDAYYRTLEYRYEDLVDETASYVSTFNYSGAWPWSGSAVSTFTDGVTADNSYTFAYDCP